jgi:predicted Zn finger-like uncharacterized protein
MHWSCPHCEARLSIGDEKLGTSWTFTRCSKCSGHALVRRSEVNLIKVDKAPPGEPILLPEGGEEPRGMLSRHAAERLRALTPKPKTAQNEGNSVEVSDTPESTPIASPALNPGKPRRSSPIRLTRAGLVVPIAIAFVAALASGVYLLREGIALGERAREAAFAQSDLSAARKLADSRRPIADELHQTAMAPARPEDAPRALPILVPPPESAPRADSAAENSAH